MRNKAYALLLALLAMPLAAFAKPERVPYFGPNGTHWPEKIPTPFMYDNTVANIIEVPCTWDAIKSAIQGVTANQANSGTLILVRPGELTGNGSSSGSIPVLESIGSLSWGQRVTVAPRDGYGSVKWKGGVRFLRVFGVCFAGFESAGNTPSGVKMQGCSRSALAWIKCTGHLGVYGTDGILTQGIELVEVVQPDHYVVSDDSADFYAGGGGFTDFRFDGCYHAPRFFEANYTGGKPHTDTIQFAAAGGGNYSNVSFRDTAVFSSNNCSIQTGNLDGMSLEKCYVVSDDVSLSRYPHLPGGASEATSNAFNGSGKNFRAVDSVFYGGMALNQRDAPKPWAFVSNTRTNKSYGDSNQPLSGAWSPNLSQAQAIALMPVYPTDSYLQGIWANPGATTEVSRPVFVPAGGTYGSPQQVTITCSTKDSTIYYTLDGSTPTINSTRYVNPFTVSATTTVKSFATAAGLDQSPVVTAEYRIVNQVADPVISPAGGLFSTPQPVTITTPTPGATIYYTLDGSTPTSASTLYTGSVLISTTSTLKAVGVRSGYDNSAVVSAAFGIGEAYIASEAWTNVTIPVQRGNFTVRWSAIPDGSQIDGVTGFALGSVDNYPDLACIVRFAVNGIIDVRNGGSYQALNTVNYTAGKIYRFEMNVDVAARTYSVIVTPDGAAPVQVANNYKFRNEQSTVTSLDHMAIVALDGGSHTVSDIVFGSTPAPTAPQGLRVVSPP